MYAIVLTGDFDMRAFEQGKQCEDRLSRVQLRVGDDIVMRRQTSGPHAKEFKGEERRGQITEISSKGAAVFVKMSTERLPDESGNGIKQLTLRVNREGEIISEATRGIPAKPGSTKRNASYQPPVPPKPARVCGYVLSADAARSARSTELAGA